MKKDCRSNPFLLLSFSHSVFTVFLIYKQAKLHTITETHIQTRKLRAVSVFVSYLPFIDSIFHQANTPFSQNRQYPTPFYLSVLYYHGNPGLLRESILLPDSTIFSPIAILSATSKNTKKWGSPTIPVNPTKPKKPCFQLILIHSSILLPVSTNNPMASIGNSRLCRC